MCPCRACRLRSCVRGRRRSRSCRKTSGRSQGRKRRSENASRKRHGGSQQRKRAAEAAREQSSARAKTPKERMARTNSSEGGEGAKAQKSERGHSGPVFEIFPCPTSQDCPLAPSKHQCRPQNVKPKRRVVADAAAYAPTLSINAATASIPRKKFGKCNFSFGACKLSSGRPNPIMTLGMPSAPSNALTIGMEPPERT